MGRGSGPFPAVVLLRSYATLLVDSFTPRGVEENFSAPKVRPRVRAYDAWAALAYLQGLDSIDAERVTVAIYPICQEIAELETPLLLLGGQEDQSLNSRDWPGLQARLQKPSGPEFRFTIYPGAYHAFDFEGLQSADPALRYDAQAAADAVDKVKEFLTRHLGAN